MANWFKFLVPAVPVVIEAVREARRARRPAHEPPAAPQADPLEPTVARLTATLEETRVELRRVQAALAALERRLDVLVVVAWSTAGVLAVVVVGLLVRLAAR